MNKIKKLLIKKGISLTPQRLAIIEYLENNSEHPTVEEIYTHINLEYPTISRATVYSTLELLRNLGAVKELSIRKRGKACFDPTTKTHYHFLCSECDRVIDVSMDSSEVYNIKKYVHSLGHQVEETHTYLYGICSDCLEKDN